MRITESIFPYEWYLKDNYVVPGVEKHGLKAFGTFICAGGTTMGLKLAGFNHLGGVELLDKYADLYEANHNPKYLYRQDMREFVERNDLPDELFDLDLLEGSPPCAAFSQSGLREDVWGKASKYENETQLKDDLPFVYTKLINRLKPKAFLLENVAGLAAGNAQPYLREIVQDVSKLYNVQVFLLYAASMGVPQIRNRIFVVGSRRDLGLNKLELDFNIPPIPFKVTEKYWGIDENNFSEFALYKTWCETKPGETHLKRLNFVKLHPDKVANTLTYTGLALTANGPAHFIAPRKLNTPELCIVSTFPMDFNFLTPKGSACVGRSVAPVMAANLVHQMNLQWFKKLTKHGK